MKSKTTTTILPLIVFAACLLSLSCGQPANQNTNTTPKASDACEASDPAQRAIAVGNKIKAKINEKPKLKDKLDKELLKVKVRKVPNVDYDYLEVLVEGKIAGDDSLKELSDILNDFQDYNCATRVVLVNPGTVDTIPDSTSAVGFLWTSCEEGMVYCNGRCKESCP